jgi:hypothetical protein
MSGMWRFQMAPGLCHWLGFVYQIFCCDGCDAVDGIFELGCYKLYDTSSGPPLRQRGRLSKGESFLVKPTANSQRVLLLSPRSSSPLALYRLFTMVSTPSQDGGDGCKKEDRWIPFQMRWWFTGSLFLLLCVYVGKNEMCLCTQVAQISSLYSWNWYF